MLAEEVEEGNTEYKLQLKGITEERLSHLVTQMRWRLEESTTNVEVRVSVCVCVCVFV